MLITSTPRWFIVPGVCTALSINTCLKGESMIAKLAYPCRTLAGSASNSFEWKVMA